MDGMLAFLPSMGPMEMLIIGVIAVLLFGKRLPEVGRSLGKGIVEFKKGLHGMENEIESATTPSTSTTPPEVDDRQETTVPKFEPPATEWRAEPQHETAQD
jgi:sec-independent protein translocase protein TatA